jgi:hypothetical protein
MTERRYRAEWIVGVGSPAILHLEQFGSIVWDAFGQPPYLVGSAAKGKVWRDVDVRLMLTDAEFLAMFGKPAPLMSWTSGKWAALCMAFSALGKQMTGLPIDFQIQDSTYANKAYDEGPRVPIGLVESRRGCERKHVEPT